jgi:hypothetical protein
MMTKKRMLFNRRAIFLLFSGFLFYSYSLSWPISESVGNQPGPAEEVLGSRPSYVQYAAFIAGISTPQGPMAAFENRPAWVHLAKFFDQNWGKYDTKQLAPMKEWAARELSAAVSSKLTVFYPFSGPDFVNPYTLFPNAGTYVLAALEPVGGIPEFQAMSDQDFDSFFDDLQHSLHDVLSIDYFISAHMHAAMEGKELKGVLPILLFFMAREKARILDVEYWFMEPDGTIEQVPAAGRVKPAHAGAIPGVRIVFESAGQPGQRQTLYYFQLNFYNATFQRNGHFIAFLKSLGPLITFTKSASYVMFNPEASAVRGFVLDQSRYVLQEDSGIPLRYFDPSVWTLQFYGAYTEPISIFKYDLQADLAQIYGAGVNIKPLPFGIGYHFQAGTSNLMLATRK